jgi:hypothetical protein
MVVKLKHWTSPSINKEACRKQMTNTMYCKGTYTWKVIQTHLYIEQSSSAPTTTPNVNQTKTNKRTHDIEVLQNPIFFFVKVDKNARPVRGPKTVIIQPLRSHAGVDVSQATVDLRSKGADLRWVGNV